MPRVAAVEGQCSDTTSDVSQQPLQVNRLAAGLLDLARRNLRVEDLHRALERQ